MHGWLVALLQNLGMGGSSEEAAAGGLACGSITLTSRVMGTAAVASRVAGTASLESRVTGTAGLEEC